jgi:hypothetical protein
MPRREILSPAQREELLVKPVELALVTTADTGFDAQLAVL